MVEDRIFRQSLEGTKNCQKSAIPRTYRKNDSGFDSHSVRTFFKLNEIDIIKIIIQLRVVIISMFLSFLCR